MFDASAVAVPITAEDVHTWRPSVPEYYSRAEVQRQTGTYVSALPAQLAGITLTLATDLVAEIEEVTVRLRDFDNYSTYVLGKENLALGPMSAILLRTESSSSSQIENLTTSAKQLALAELGQSSKVNAETVVGNVRAMEAAVRLSAEPSIESILLMHEELLRRQPRMEPHAGKIREELVWIGGRDSAGPRGATYIAPQPQYVLPALHDLMDFIHRADIPVLAQIAIAHAQFETIHPFVDGNGRTGRALAQLLLRNKELTTHTTVPISAGILTDTERYFDALGSFRSGNARPIIEVFTDATRYSCVTGRELVDHLSVELDEAKSGLEGVRSQASAWRVIPLLAGQPAINAAYLKEKLGINDASAQRTLETLTQRGILAEKTGKSRNRVWIHQGILNVLDEYAANLKRRANFNAK